MKILGVLLAGGKSTRMGQDKALLEWENKSLLEHQFLNLKETLDKYRASIVVSGQRNDFPHIKDQISNLGPLGGVHSVVETLIEDQWVLVVAIDMPYLLNDKIDQLIHEFDYSEFEAIQFENYELPFLFHFNEKSKQILLKLVQDSEGPKRSIRNFLSQMNTQKIILTESEKEKFININDFETYQKARPHLK